MVFCRSLGPGVPEQGNVGPLRWIIFLISAATCVSGLVQLFFPEFVLRIVGAERGLAARHFFAIVGMFMFLFGGMMIQALRSFSRQSVAIFWAALQKFGASMAVAIGVERGVFNGLALSIASFDFICGVLIIWYWMRVRPGGYATGN